jgi:hypothetical protein
MIWAIVGWADNKLDRCLDIFDRFGKNLPLKKMTGTQTFNMCLTGLLVIAFLALVLKCNASSKDAFLAFILIAATAILCCLFVFLLPKFK